MFVMNMSEWPSMVEVLRPTLSGDLVEYACALSESSADDVTRECRRCNVRLIVGTPMYRDASSLGTWHRDCFLELLRVMLDAGNPDRWYMRNVWWVAPQ
jgi:hypothetical protein